MTIWPLTIAAAASVPLITAAVAPRRWLKRSMALVLVSPVILYFAIIVWEMLTRPSEANALGLAFSGFVIMSAFLTIPWLVVCLVGFGIGFGIRRILRGNRDQAAQSVSRPTSESTTDMAHWRSVHIGFSHDGLKIGDVDVWEHEWRAVAGSLLRLAHPAYPNQIHGYRMFDAGDERQSARFAASELSNGVWGFYVARSDMAPPQHVSADRSLLHEHRAGDVVGGRLKTTSGVWRTGLLILVGTCIAIAVASHRVARYSPIRKQELTPMPKMPDFERLPRTPIQRIDEVTPKGQYRFIHAKAGARRIRERTGLLK